jgi:hypothetical protein
MSCVNFRVVLGAWFLIADVSEHCVYSIFTRLLVTDTCQNIPEPPPPLPTRRNKPVSTCSPNQTFLSSHTSHLLAYEGGTDTVFRNVGY